MSIPFKSLDAVTSAVAGSALDLETVVASATLQVTSTGTPATCRVVLEGSLHGSNWFQIPGSSQATLDGISGTVQLSAFSAAIFRYLRARVSSLSGGTSPTVTAWVVAL